MSVPDAASEFERAVQLHRAGQFAEALSAYDAAVLLKPDHVQAIANGANVLRLMGRMNDALARYDRAIALKVDAVTLYNRGNAREALEHWPDAVSDYEKAIALKPNFPEALNNLGNVLNAMREPAQALPYLSRAIKCRPHYAEALVNRGNVWRDLLEFDKALADYDAALALKPDFAEAFSNRGVLWRDRLHFVDAQADFRTAIGLSPQDGYCEAAWNLGLTQLLQGDWEQGWAGYDQRLLQAAYQARGMDKIAPAWNGEALAGKRLLLWTEQGYGDMIQFIRFAQMLPEAQITVLAPAHMHRVLSTASPALCFAEVLSKDQTFDFQSPLMSLPRLLNITPDNVPNAVPYIKPDDAALALWQSRLPPGFKVGLVWQGNPNGRVDKGRSLPFPALLPLTEIKDISFISLQKGYGLEQLTAGIEIPQPEFDEGADAFMDTAAIISHLDLVITPDTAIAHLAGALGRPVWLMLKAVPDWRWLLTRRDTPWYPSMRLYRQARPGDWAGVVNDMMKDLRQLV